MLPDATKLSTQMQGLVNIHSIGVHLPHIFTQQKMYNDYMEPTQDEVLLTAYLDGELEPPERQGLEQRLVDEPELRQLLTLLEETWHYLDLLEREYTDAEKIETTLKAAAIVVSVPSFLPVRMNRWRRWSIAAFVGLALFVLTFQIGNRTPADISVAHPTEVENKQLAETLSALPLWEKESLLYEEPKTIINTLKLLWNKH